MYRRRGGSLEVLLVHPGGPFWKKRDLGAWSIPKGEIGEGEEPLDVARREFREETGARPEGDFVELRPVKQKGGKIVRAWAVESDLDPERIESNTFTIEWPPGSGKTAEFPEVDRAGWFTVEEARDKINPAQVGLIDEFVERLRA
jgi:predicted NUDIX family NTP pyrophosphohydrolase